MWTFIRGKPKIQFEKINFNTFELLQRQLKMIKFKFQILFILFFQILSVAKSQNLTSVDTLKGFWGIPFSTSKSKVISILKSKGIQVETSKIDPDNLVTIKKEMFGGREAFQMIFSFYKGTFCKSAVFYQTKIPRIEDDFNSVMNQINKRYFYGKRSANFKYPYEENGKDSEYAISMGFGELTCDWNFASNKIELSTMNAGESIYVVLEYKDVFHSSLLTDKKINNSDY